MRPILPCILFILIKSIAISGEVPRTFNPDSNDWFVPDLSCKKNMSELNLRFLNEKTAGEHGWISMKDGKLYRGDGKPTRFVGTGTGKYYALPDKKTLSKKIKNMADMGMNLQRYRVRLMFSKKNTTGEPDIPGEGYLDNFFWSVAEAKKNGIYTYFSAYFPLTGVTVKNSNVDGMAPGKKPFALIFFDERSQEIYRKQVTLLLKSKNPYTGKTLANDPALGMIEVINEDNLFFHTFHPTKVPLAQWEKIEIMFGDFLQNKYGSLEKAMRNLDQHKNDDIDAKRVGLLPAGYLNGRFVKKGAEKAVNRAREQAEFFVKTQKDFYKKIIKWYRNELRVKCPIICSNWRTASPFLTDALERYSYHEGEVLDIHRYYNCGKKGQPNWVVKQGHTFENRPAILDPLGYPIQFIQYKGKASSVSEINVVHPNYYRAEFIPMLFSYGALQGMDCILPFNYDSVVKASMWHGYSPFAMNTPLGWGALPAFALAYRKGYIKEASPVIEQKLSLPHLYALKGTFADAQGLDAMREQENHNKKKHSEQANGAFSPYAYYTGKIERSFTDAPSGKLKKADLSEFIDLENSSVKSITKQMNWNWQKGLFTLDSQYIQGAAGFLKKAGKIDLSALSINCDNHYAAIFLVSVDGLPLRKSSKIFLQVITGERPKVWKSSPTGEGKRIRIDEFGKKAWMVKRPEGNVKIKCGDFTVSSLNLNGCMSDIKANYKDNTLDIKNNVCWYLLTRNK